MRDEHHQDEGRRRIAAKEGEPKEAEANTGQPAAITGARQRCAATRRTGLADVVTEALRDWFRRKPPVP